MNRQRIIANLTVMAGGQATTLLISMVYSILISRYLGPLRLGEFLLAGAIVSTLVQVTELGISPLITRTVARSPERAGQLVSAAVILRASVIAPIFLVLISYAHFAHVNHETAWTIYLVGLSALIGSFGNPMLATFQGRGEMSLNALWMVAQNLLLLATATLVIALHMGVVVLACSQVAVAGVLLVLDALWMRRFGHLTLQVSSAELKAMVVNGTAFWATTIFLTIYLYIDSVMLGSLAGSHAVGIYGPPTKLFSVALFAPTIVSMVTLPLLSRLGIADAMDFARVSRTTLSLLFVAAVPITIGLATFASPLMLTVFGAGYRESVPVLVVLALCLGPTFWNIQFSQVLAARDRQWRWTVVMAVSCLVNPLLNWFLIPVAVQHWHNGAAGAACALLFTEVLMAGYGVIMLRDIVQDGAFARSIAGAVFAGAAQLATLALFRSWLPVAEAAGIVVFAGVAVALGAVPRGEVTLLRHYTMSRAQRLVMRRVVPVAPTLDSANEG